MLLNIEEKVTLLIDNINNFLYKNRYLILIGIFTCIFVYGIDIVTYKFGLDGFRYSFGGIDQYYNEQRYGSIIYWLIYFHF